MKKLQRGDTIIEVLLALAVIGLVLGLSYASANRAMRSGRFAQEQTEAVKLAEGQIERLKYIAGLTDADRALNNIFDSGLGKTQFCISDTFAKVLTTDAAFGTTCKGLNGLYDQVVTYEKGATSTDTFTVKISWVTPVSDQDGTVQIAYRLHP